MAAASMLGHHVVDGQFACTEPQYWHVCRSRLKTSRRLSLTRGCGRLTWYWSRITEGAGMATVTVWMTWWLRARSSAFSAPSSRNARPMQTLSGS